VTESGRTAVQDPVHAVVQPGTQAPLVQGLGPEQPEYSCGWSVPVIDPIVAHGQPAGGTAPTASRADPSGGRVRKLAPLFIVRPPRHDVSVKRSTLGCDSRGVKAQKWHARSSRAAIRPLTRRDRGGRYWVRNCVALLVGRYRNQVKCS